MLRVASKTYIKVVTGKQFGTPCGKYVQAFGSIHLDKHPSVGVYRDVVLPELCVQMAGYYFGLLDGHLRIKN